jgi:phosphonate transport system substrate-binding protein
VETTATSIPTAGMPAVRRRSSAVPRAKSLRVASCLAPHLGWFYEFLAHQLGKRLGLRIEYLGDIVYERLADVDLAFVCSLAYIEHPAIGARFVPLAAPVLAGERYGDEPVYYSDVIVHRQSTLRSFADLRGRSWAYNEVYSQSGYGITCYHLAHRGETRGYFGQVIEAGRHDRAIAMVAGGDVDAAAIDSHVLQTFLRLRPDLTATLRVIDSLGPSPIQPVLARRSLQMRCKHELRRAFVHLHNDLVARSALGEALVRRFVPVNATTYDEVRTMRRVSEAAGLRVLK